MTKLLIKDIVQFLIKMKKKKAESNDLIFRWENLILKMLSETSAKYKWFWIDRTVAKNQ